MYLYNDEMEQLYVHHDMMMPDMPLCCEWIGAAPRTRQAGNWAAVGTLGTDVELWNLDVLNPTNPHEVLQGVVQDRQPAGMDQNQKKKKKKKKKTKGKTPAGELGGHADAVLGLAWNSNQVNVLASASADCTVRLWDLNEVRCSAVLRDLHQSKVQSVSWCPSQATVLATGGFDRSARIADVRNAAAALRLPLGADVEAMTWLPGGVQLLISTEEG